MSSLVRAEDAVLVVIDLQEKLLPAIADAQRVAEQCRRLILGAAALGVPILATEQYPKGLGPTVEPVRAALAEAEAGGAAVRRIEKTTFSCARATEFLEALEATGREQALLCGIEAHICVLQTAVELLADDSQVYVAGDAVGSRLESNRILALERLLQAGAVVAPVESLLYEMLGDSRHPAFKTVCGLVKE